MARLWQANDHIRLQPTLGGGVANLRLVVHALFQTGHLKHARQHQLAPIATRLGRTAQGLGQVDGVGAQGLVESGQLLHLLFEG